MLTTNNILNFQQQQQQQQQHYPHPYNQLNKVSSSLDNTLPVYTLFNSIPLFHIESLSNHGLVNDHGSSTTVSPKEEFLDYDCYLKLRHGTDVMQNDNVVFQLQESRDTVQKQQETIHFLQSAIVLKDMEIQKLSEMMAAMSPKGDNLSINEMAAFKIKNKVPLSQTETFTNYSENINKWTRWNEEGNKKTENMCNDYDLLVNKILQSNDQQSSIFLQQRLKTCNLEQKQLIFESIERKAYDLMINRFGNFLVQRIFEFGTKEQISKLAQTMVDRVLTLTRDPFGCHVVQKALDFVDEETKANLVTELFQEIPDTILHKSACHVWQKVFEIRWENYPIQIMAHIYKALEGRWTQVALDETGSLVIQNMFENLDEKDKRPVINEILDNMFTIARGQWGNWVIQHILEQAENSKDRETAFSMVLHRGIELCMDQFASKVVEKALSIGGAHYMSKFIHHISTSNRSHRPRIALIDIAADQYGNYVVQWIINNAPKNHKIDVCKKIKKHMVSLRGSKYGQRVAYLVEKSLKNQEITTYPFT